MKGDLRHVIVYAHTARRASVISDCDECEEGKVELHDVSLGKSAALRDAIAKKPEVLCASCQGAARS